jgi:hypothetical protein
MVAKVVADNTAYAAATYGLFGAVLGMAMGMAGGLARRSVRAGLHATVAGLIAGANAGLGMSIVVLPMYYRRFNPEHEDLMLSILMHAAIWSAIGAAAGLAFGIGTGGRGRAVRALLGGLLGALIATMLYDAIGGVLLPLDKTNQPIASTSGTRLLAQLLVAVFASGGAALCFQEPPSRAKHTSRTT